MTHWVCSDIARYHSTDISKDKITERGWISVRGDVFRQVAWMPVSSYSEILFLVFVITCKNFQFGDAENLGNLNTFLSHLQLL